MKPDPALSITPKRIVKRAEKHLNRFAGRLAEISARDDPDTIHDIRVSSRRLQQVFAIIFPKPRTGKQREVIRILRKVRRRLGGCRSLDVNLELIAKAINDARDPAARSAWEQFRSHVEKERKREIKRSRKKLSGYRRSEFIALSHKCLERISPEFESRNISAALQESLEQARKRLDETLLVAKQNPDPERLHALRIAAKRLRYRAELLAAFGDGGAKVWVKELKGLQQSFGGWHDRHVLFQSAAQFVGRPNFLLSHPEIARSLLDDMERQRNEEVAVVESIIKRADKLSDTLAAARPVDSGRHIRPVELSSYRRFARQPS